jgi:hypothetical protein
MIMYVANCASARKRRLVEAYDAVGRPRSKHANQKPLDWEEVSKTETTPRGRGGANHNVSGSATNCRDKERAREGSMTDAMTAGPDTHSNAAELV